MPAIPINIADHVGGTPMVQLTRIAPEGVELFAKFQAYGELPCIFRNEDKTLSGLGFNALIYAKQRGAELCGK